MSKISNTTNYPQQSPVASADFLIGTDAVTSKTKTFTVQSLADFIDGQVTLAEVLAAGNTDGGLGMSVTGASSFGNLTLTGTLTAGGGVGTAGQVLSSTGAGIEWSAPTISGEQYKIPFFNTTSTLGDSMISQDSGSNILTISPAGAQAQVIIPMYNDATNGIKLLGGASASVNRPTISPVSATGDVRFGDQGSGQVFDFQQNKIAFDTDATNTFIKADNNDPESLEIHADNDVNLLADRHVIINGTVPATASSSGIRGAVIYDDDYIYMCVQPNTWKRAAISTW